MNNSSLLFKNRYTMMLISAVLSAVLFISMISCGYQIRAWFIQKDNVRNEAVLSNFVTKVEYSIDGAAFLELKAGQPISNITPENVDTLKIKLSYKGISSAYLRVRLYGSFYNADTRTVLPQSTEDGFWSFADYNDDQWLLDDGYYYYKNLLHNVYRDEAYSFVQIGDELTVSVNTDVFDNRSEYQDYNGELYVIVDAVQPDRREIFWPSTATSVNG